MNYALLDNNNIIINVIVLTDESNYTPPEELTLIQIPADTAAGIGWTYTNGQFIAPPTPEPVPPTLEQQRAVRSNAYKEEADPLFFKSQRGEATIEEWKNKIEEIKLRYPYPINRK